MQQKIYIPLPCNETVDVYNPLLPDPMRSVHGLKILHRVPVVLDEYDGVGAREVEPEAADAGSQQEQVDARVRVKPGPVVY